MGTVDADGATGATSVDREENTVQTTASADAAVPNEPTPDPGRAVADAAAGVTAVSAATQEVRFATAMTGGVSLAVWMGGVARELNLLDQASRRRESASYEEPALSAEDTMVRDFYRALLELLDQVVRIDVLSGTSAGGLNAVFLGLCHARGLDMGGLRDTWFDAGALDELLRDPAEKSPPSLMYGDRKFLTAMDKAIKVMAAPAAGPARDTTVYVTTTLLDGETSRFTDSYGTVVPDVDHLGIFTFGTAALTSTEPGWAEALALAARSSASFPGAFEPAFLPFGTGVAADGVIPQRPNMEQYTNITRAHWVADGGILANRPIAPLLESIFARPAEGREVRRVLLYIVPDPGGSATAAVDPDRAAIERPLSLGQALLADVGAALNQSISADLTAIRRHNDRVDSVRDSRLRLAEVGALLGAAGQEFPVRAAREDFAARQSESNARPIVDRIMRALTAFVLPDLWKHEVRIGASFEERCRHTIREAIAGDWADAPTPGDYAVFAGFGRSAFDGARSIYTSVIRTAFAAADDRDTRARLADLSTRLAAAFVPDSDIDLDRSIADALRVAATSTPPPPLVDVVREIATAYLDDRAKGTSSTVLESGPLPVVASRSALGDGWRAVGLVVAEAVPLLRSLIPATPDPDQTSPDGVASAEPDAPPSPVQPPPLPQRSMSVVAASGRLRRGDVRQRAIARLETYLDYLGDDPDWIAAQLLNLHIAERSVLPIGMEIDQPVELVQVSATTRTQLDLQRSTAKDKLTGVQFNHFGAFYKRSWRANDWMWGRLDGAGWLVHVLLDPRRILTIVEARDTTEAGEPQSGSAWFIRELKRLFGIVGLSLTPVVDEPKVVDELRFLDDAGVAIPTSLPITAMWVATALQSEIVNAELPVVATQILSSPTRRDTTWALDVLTQSGQERQAVSAAGLAIAEVSVGRAASKARAMLQDSATAPRPALGPPASLDRMMLAKKLPTCPVADEKLAQEHGEPLFSRTLTHAVAVATAATTSIDGLPASLSPAFASARTVTLGGYRAVDITGAVPKRTIAAGAIITAIGAFLAVQNSTVLGVTGVVTLVIGLYLLALGVWGLRTRVLPILIGITIAGFIVWLCTPSGRHTIFGTTEDDPGWLTQTVEPWLRDSWWAILAVIAGFLALSALWALITKPRRGITSKPEQPT